MKLVVNELKYEVTMTDKVNDADDLGIFNCETQTIKIKSSLSNEQKIRTFLHELVHLYMWCYGFADAEFNEETICNFIAAYFEPMQKDLKRFICEFIKKEEKSSKLKKITLKEFWNSKKHLAIHCNTKEKAEKLLEAFDKLGKKWFSGYSYLVINCWDYYKKNTCYDNMNSYTSINRYKAHDYTIYEFEDVDLGEEQ